MCTAQAGGPPGVLVKSPRHRGQRCPGQVREVLGEEGAHGSGTATEEGRVAVW